MLRRYIRIGSLSMAAAVALGAFGAHILESHLTPERLATWETAVQYHMIHAVALIIIALFADKLQELKKVLWSLRLLWAGTLIFSGSLYILCLSGIGVLGAITPIGGVAFILGWIMLFLAARSVRS
ncbi:MAG: DUF423 domain-containing protein [Paenibacillus sp.]|uniref:Uncharacterized membrane protein YgdD, TMEM256/DUF423 family n=1 Tax=Paenibacillus aquistagni TaxID=1852522 RepID=A0A1X7LM60_9BACL|nr:DUF423 domain-containing protein [Paenibacillus aquistagni]MBR2568692.1 DUF423 domain-containing protein [Paenibacillus sp.]SMG54413.1 Uncharacterized membrane protein YgdD, TMEM256/DUF423 family [Paenibacillus aquistagni]